MNHALKAISLVALAATVLPSTLYFFGLMEHNAVKILTLVGTVAWFIATPMWMERTTSAASNGATT